MNFKLNLINGLILAFILLLSIFFRIYFYWDKIIIDSSPYLTDTDVLFHLRRAEICIRHYPWLPVFNSYEEYPKGSYYESPLLHAFILATIAYIAGGFKYNSPEFTRWILIFYPPLLSAFAIYLLHLLSRLLFKSIRIAHLTSLLAASFPIAIQYSYLGNIDHHISDYIGIILYYLFLIKSIENIKDASIKGLIKLAMLPGAMLSFAFYVWQASFLHAFISSLSFILYYFLEHKREIFLFAALHFYWCCLFLLPGDIYTAIGGVPWNSLAFFSFGQFLIIFIAASFFFAFYHCIDPKTYRILNPIKLKSAWLTMIIIILCLYPLIPDIYEGFRILIHNPIPWLRSVTESTPILFIYHKFSLYPLISNFSYASLIFPIFLFLFYREIIKKNHYFSWLLIANAGLVYFLLTNAQARFGYPFTIPLAIISSYYIVKLSELFIQKFITKKNSIVALTSVVLSIVILIPCKAYYKKEKLFEGYLQLKEVFDWIKNNTPPTSDYDTAQKKPEYSILADWEYGTFIEYYAQRPINIDARGPLYSDWSPIAKFLLSQTEEEANAIREKLGIKYILLTDWYASLRIYPEWMKANWFDYFTYVPTEDGEEAIMPKEKLIFSIGFQMSEFAGGPIIASDKIIKPSLQHYRLVWESSKLLFGGRREPTTSLKLIEYVKGAKLHCFGNPNGKIEVIGLVITNIGRTFQYHNYATISSTGDSVIYLPYPTIKNKSTSVFIERYYIQKENKVIQLKNISEEMIEKGIEIKCE